MFSAISEIIEEIRSGRPVIVVDDEGRENEGDLVVAAQFANPNIINFMISQARGLVCVPLTSERARQLSLEPMHYESGRDRFQTAWKVSVDAASGITTGISAYDRARTVEVLIDPKSSPADLIKPGHLFPLEAKDGGVLVRAGHTEAAVDLASLAGLYPSGVICEIINSDGSMARLNDLIDFSKKHNLKLCTIASLIEYRRKKERLVVRKETVKLPTEYGDFTLYLYESIIDKSVHPALCAGDIGQEPVLVRVHSECLTGDAFFSSRCDCGKQLHKSMELIAKNGGVLLYMRQEGRGIGLEAKMRAYRLQDEGADTVEANTILGFEPDLRDYGIGAQMLVDLGVKKIKLITNNPKKIIGLEGYGLEIAERVPLACAPGEENRSYLDTKKKKLDHLF